MPHQIEKSTKMHESLRDEIEKNTEAVAMRMNQIKTKLYQGDIEAASIAANLLDGEIHSLVWTWRSIKGSELKDEVKWEIGESMCNMLR